MGTMTAAVKARLRAAGAKRKGKTLKGCDPVKWAAALEAIRAPARLQSVHLDMKGRKYIRASELDIAFMADDDGFIRWARLRHDTPEHLEMLCDVIPWRLIRVPSFDGKMTVYRDVIVFQVENIMALLALLFGISNLGDSAKKYLYGYDDKIANER